MPRLPSTLARYCTQVELGRPPTFESAHRWTACVAQHSAVLTSLFGPEANAGEDLELVSGGLKGYLVR
jgi:hypothetical protein